MVRYLRQTPDAAAVLGIFENHGDVGTVSKSGSVTFDDGAKSYTLTGSGENMWSTRDAFHYVWKKASGDVALAADISFKGAGKEPHRKACLIIRQSLDADSAYVDAALHGDGLTSLQFREAKGAATHEVQANVLAPLRLRIEKIGKYARMYLGSDDKEPSFSGAAVRLTLEEPFYVGLGVCAHNNDAIETADFSHVELAAPLAVSSSARRSCTARSKPRRSHRPIAVSFTSRPPGSKHPTGCTTVPRSSITATDGSYACPRQGARRRPSTPALPFAATMIMAFHRMATCWRSATSRRGAGSL